MKLDRRTLIAGAGAGLAGTAFAAANRLVDLHLPGGPSERPMDPGFPEKGEMIVQRVRPPLLETPRAVFDRGVITPNDRFFVRWHWPFPTEIDTEAFRLTIRGAVAKPIDLSLEEVVRAGEPIEFAAVNQCAGNGRGLFEPRVAGAQWANGAMGNALWRGVRLRDLLDKAGVGANAKHVRFKGLDTPLLPEAPHFIKSLPIARARADDTIIAYRMNGDPLPVLNGFPLRLIVPGWFSTYWVKMLSDIEVLTGEDGNFWMAKAYRMPTVPVKPGDKDFPTVPIAAMPPRAFITSHEDGEIIKRGQPLELRGLALGGDAGVAKVEIVGGPDAAGKSFTAPAILEPEQGAYGFRRWRWTIPEVAGDIRRLGARCTNSRGATQPDVQAWNPSGYARDLVERINLRVA